MSHKEWLCKRIEETRKKVIKLIFAGMLIKKSCKHEKDVTREWAIKAEEILNDIDRKYEEFYRYCRDFHKIAIDEERREKKKDTIKHFKPSKATRSRV